MKLAIVYDKFDHKLAKTSYSHAYRDMFLSLINRFDSAVGVRGNCNQKDIDADVIIFFDIHSAHHIEIEDICNHKAIKYTYFNDPHQRDSEGTYRGGTGFHKLGAKQRVARAMTRGIHYIICPYKNGYYKYIAPHIGRAAENMFIWFPIAPKAFEDEVLSLTKRKNEVILNGHLWQGEVGFRPYNFRRWLYEKPYIENKVHCLADKRIPQGSEYVKFLSNYTGVIAACDTYVVPKYIEIPMAGCVCFAQEQLEYYDMGFRDMESCIIINKGNAKRKIHDFKANVKEYQDIANAGRNLVLSKWTSDNFADCIYNHAAEKLKAPASVVGANLQNLN